VSEATKTAQHGLSEHSHGFGVPIQTRSERPKSTKLSDFDEISTREEQWRYISVDRLGGLDQDSLDEFSGDIEAKLADGVESSWIDSDHKLFGFAGIPEDRVAAAGWEAAKAAYLVSIPGSAINSAQSTLTITSISADPAALHIIVEARKGSDSVVVIDHRGDATLSENIEFVLEDEAKLTVVSIQDWNAGSIHNGAQYAMLGRNSSFKHVMVTLGGAVVRMTPSAYFGAPGGDAALYGLYFADAGQYLEHRIFVDHSAPNCKSRVTYKGALQGAKAHTVWVGDVLIRAAAEGTDTYELNRNLLLTDGARADSVPNLEIETGQIQGAGHASASGRFDDEQLFYLQARGLSEFEARRLVVRGFLMEVVQQIGLPELEERLAASIEDELERSAS
jgi:Fe-S cluster assembly protein SufD